MDNKKSNLAKLLTDARSRILLLLLTSVVIIVLVIALRGMFDSGVSYEDAGGAAFKDIPNIDSVPGSISPNLQYAKLQETENEQRVERAQKTGGSSIPTIIKTEQFSNATDFINEKGEIVSSTNDNNEKSFLGGLQSSQCSRQSVDFAMLQGATIKELMTSCECSQLKVYGFKLEDLVQDCPCKSLKESGYSAKELKNIVGYSVVRLRQCGYSACDLRGAGFTAAQLAEAGYSVGELKGAGYLDNELKAATGIPEDVSLDDLNDAGCNPSKHKKLREQGVTAAAVRQKLGCSVFALKSSGYTKNELQEAGFTDAEVNNQITVDCSVNSIAKAKQQGMSAKEIRERFGCSAKALQQAGFSADELKKAGFNAAELKAAGFSADELKNAGFNAAELKEAGLIAKELRDAGFSANALLSAEFSADELKDAGFSDEALLAAGLSKADLGISDPAPVPAAVDEFAYVKDEKLKQALAASQVQKQRLQNKTDIKKIQSMMRSYASIVERNWLSGNQVVVEQDNKDAVALDGAQMTNSNSKDALPAMIKAGDIKFAVLETAVNSDEPGPILARISQGRFKGAKLIGKIEVPAEGKKAILKFDTISIQDANNSIKINAVAIDLNTARTAISSRTNNHYITRYGALFASSFLEGFGKSITGIQTQITTTGGVLNTRAAAATTKEALYASLGTVGEKWGEYIGSFVDRKPTIYIYAGVGLGILFLSDVAEIQV